MKRFFEKVAEFSNSSDFRDVKIDNCTLQITESNPD